MNPYSKEESLRELSFQYIIDAYQFCQQAETLLEDANLVNRCEYHIGYLKKISVTLYMSIECSLKSMICACHVNEDPHSVYWKKIRPAGHSIQKLRQEISSFSADLKDPTLEKEINQLSAAEVSERYCVEVSSEEERSSDERVDLAKLNLRIEQVRHLLDTANKLRKNIWGFRSIAFDSCRVLPRELVKDALKKIKTK